MTKRKFPGILETTTRNDACGFTEPCAGLVFRSSRWWLIAQRLAGVITSGALDSYLTLPKNVLLHVLISATSASGWGDLAFGLVAFTLGLAALAWFVFYRGLRRYESGSRLGAQAV